MSFLVYEKYKDSGAEWLGVVPEGWSVKRLKNVCGNYSSNVDKKSVEGQSQVSLCNYTDVYYNEEITPRIDFMQATATDSQIDKFTLRGGDVIITKDSEDPNDIGVPTYVPHDLPGVICGYHLSVLRANHGTEGAYIKRLFDTSYVKSSFATLANGLTRYGLGHDAISGLVIPVPPLAEQTAIASFLDTETSKIDSLVSEQRRLIELLKEKRQAVISHAVTKGLNPNASLAKSGQSWVPEFPAQWTLTRYRSLVRVRTVLVGDRHREYQLLSLTKRGVIVRDLSTGAGKHSDYLERSQEVRPGDIVFCMFDVEETPRTVGLSKHLGMISGDYTVLECTNKDSVRFIEYFYIAMDDRKRLGSLYTGLRKRIHKRRFLSIKTPMPPPEELTSIVEHIDEQTQKLSSLIAQTERAIELLQERRTALISAAVTGKIDVREYATEVIA
jgi:type I restriction enzyme S subunit